MLLGHLQVLAEDVLPALKHSPGASADGGRIVRVADLPLGFSTGGAASPLQRAAT